MLTCPGCGRIDHNDSKFCMICGTALTQNAPTRSDKPLPRYQPPVNTYAPPAGNRQDRNPGAFCPGQQPQPPIYLASADTGKTQKSKMPILIALIAVILLIGGTLTVTLLVNRDKLPSPFRKEDGSAETAAHLSEEEETRKEKDRSGKDRSEDDKRNGHPQQSFTVSPDTPGHAGLNLRGEATSASELICVVPEGAAVIVTGEETGGYVPVIYYSGNREYTGWLMKIYLLPEGDGIASKNTAVISSDTPDHAGLVVRAEATSSSSKITVLNEGTELILQGQSANGYTLVKTSDGSIQGWVLEMYLIKK